MALFYQGKRPVLKGRKNSDSKNPYKGNVVGTYSNWSIYNSSHVLDGAPNSHVDPGTGDYPGDYALSRYFLGTDTKSAIVELRAVGGGVRIEGMRYRPLENKAAGNNKVFKSVYGHAGLTPATRVYSFDDYIQGTYRPTLITGGHAVRYVDASGTANSFGSFGPWTYKGVTTAALSETHQSYPTDPNGGDYGRNKINEWRGVTSTKALNV